MTVPMVAHELGDFRIDIFRSDLVIRRVDHEQCVSSSQEWTCLADKPKLARFRTLDRFLTSTAGPP